MTRESTKHLVGSCTVGSVGSFWCCEITKKISRFSLGDGRSKVSVLVVPDDARHALKTRGTTRFAVLSALAPSGAAQVFPSVIAWVKIPMVNVERGFLSSDHFPDDAVGKIVRARTYRDRDVTVFSTTSVNPTVAREMASGGVITEIRKKFNLWWCGFGFAHFVYVAFGGQYV